MAVSPGHIALASPSLTIAIGATLASSFALSLSESNPKDRVLLLAADPAHALSDLWKKKLGGKPTRLTTGKGEGGLYAAEYEAPSRPSLLAEYATALKIGTTALVLDLIEQGKAPQLELANPIEATKS